MKPYHEKKFNDSHYYTSRVEYYVDESSCLHNLEGPAVVQVDERVSAYYIYGDHYTKEEWEKHPLVVEYLVWRVMNEVLGE